jgi:hypothetical protein
MAQRTIEAEIDGKRRTITADIPDGATQDQIISAVKSYLKTSQPSPSSPPPTLGQKLYKGIAEFGQTGLELGEGAIAGSLSTLYHGGDIIRRATGAKRIINQPNVQKLITPPSTLPGNIGFGLEQTGEFFLPTGEEKAAAALTATAGPKLARIARTAADAFKVGGVTTAQTGDIGSGLRSAATTGAINIITPVITKGLGLVGRKIQASTIRPRATDVKDGFSWSTLDKFKLKGNLDQSLKQVEGKLAELRTARNALIAPGSATINLNQVLLNVGNEIRQEVTQLKYAGEGSKIMGAFYALKYDILQYSLRGLPGLRRTWGAKVDIRVAENAKEYLGMLGSWAYGRPDREGAAAEAAANKAYLGLKNGIEQAIGPQGPEVRALNKQMQELIPVKHAMIARIPIEDRNRVFSLADIAAMLPAAMTGNAADLGLVALTRAQKSLRLGNWLIRNAGNVSKPILGKTAGIGERALEGMSEPDQTSSDK